MVLVVFYPREKGNGKKALEWRMNNEQRNDVSGCGNTYAEYRQEERRDQEEYDVEMCQEKTKFNFNNAYESKVNRKKEMLHWHMTRHTHVPLHYLKTNISVSVFLEL